MSTITIQDLTDNERIVLDVVQEYLNKNKTFDMTEVIPFINSRFRAASININNEGLKKILQSLVKKRFLLHDSKLTKESILRNQTRKEIYYYIQENPGTYLNHLLKAFQLNNKIVVWHLRMLENFGFIKRLLHDNRHIYCDVNLQEKDALISYFSINKKSSRILQYLKQDYSGVTKTRIANELDMHFNTVSKYVDALTSINLIELEKIDNKELYFLK